VVAAWPGLLLMLVSDCPVRHPMAQLGAPGPLTELSELVGFFAIGCRQGMQPADSAAELHLRRCCCCCHWWCLWSC
jgi:hypothetical protein